MAQAQSILLVTSDPEAVQPVRRSLALLQPVQTLCLTDPRDDAIRHMLAHGDGVSVIVSDVVPRGVDIVRGLRGLLDPFRLLKTPILCLVTRTSPRDEVQAWALGASAVLATGSTSGALVAAVRGMLQPGETHPGLQPPELELQLAVAVTDVGVAVADMLSSAKQGGRISTPAIAEASGSMLQGIGTVGISAWMRLVSEVDDQTYRHCMMVAGFVAAFAMSLGFSHGDCDRLTRAALMHDIGKAFIPLDILNKPGPLDATQAALMRSHACLGDDLLRAQGGHGEMTLDVVRHHHEHLDGSGYPDGLSGRGISDPVRIATICDIFAALIERRAYKSPMTDAEAFHIMRGMTGKLDMQLLTMFGRLFARPMPRSA